MTEAELRPTRLGWSVLCFVLFAILALLVRLEWSPLLELDADLGELAGVVHAGRTTASTSSGAGLSIATSTLPEAIADRDRRRVRSRRRATGARRSGRSA